MAVVLGILSWVTIVAPAAAAAIDIATLMATLSKVAASRASFVEERELQALTVPLTSRGELAYRAPDHLEKRTTEPVVESIMVDGDRLTYAKPAEGLERTLGLAQAPELHGLVEAVRGTLAGDIDALRRFYSVGLEGSLDQWRLTLVPTDDRLRGYLKVVRVDGVGAAVRRIETIEADGDRSLMRIEPPQS